MNLLFENGGGAQNQFEITNIFIGNLPNEEFEIRRMLKQVNETRKPAGADISGGFKY